MKSLKVDELNELYETAKTLDKEAVAEMRSNILLISGEHFSKRMNEWWNRSRTTQGQSQTDSTPKLRITKNWLHRAHRIYVTSILSQAPTTKVSPRNEMELQDQKSAELNDSVKQYLFSKMKMKAKVRDFCSDFIGIGECAALLKFDPTRGYFKGYEGLVDETGQPVMDPQSFQPAIDPMTGQPAIDPMTGQPVMDPNSGQQLPDESKPVFSGEFVAQRLYGQNIFRDPSIRQMCDAQWLGVETVESTKHLKKKYQGQDDKLKMLDDSSEEYVVFDSNKLGYSKEKDQTVIKEIYYKPCMDYPKGWFYIFTKAGILEEGELPGSIFPIVWKGCDEHPTKPRATGIVKVARPWQAEINRASSQAALHQITVGDDKLIYQAGTKVSQGSLLPGVRGFTYQGLPPTILPGRTGEQYTAYIASQEQELNRALMIDMLDEDKLTNLEPMAMLFRSMSQSKKFSVHAEKFGEFLIELTEVLLDLAKFYLEGDELIAAIGKAETINIAEFKATSPLCHRIVIEEQNDAIETKLGKHLVMTSLLQYAGTSLNREDIGKLATEMPYGNWQNAFKDFTIDSKNVKNDFLAIERGEMPKISGRDKSDYILTQVATRKKERDYGLLPPQVQQAYDQYEQYHLQKMGEEAAKLKAMESEYIPVGGAMIAADMYIPQKDPAKAPKRVRVPYQALDWLINMLEKQGMGMGTLEAMNKAQASEVAQGVAGPGQAPPISSGSNQGQASPI